MKKLLDNMRIFMATAMLISGSVFAQSNATDNQYYAHVTN